MGNAGAYLQYVSYYNIHDLRIYLNTNTITIIHKKFFIIVFNILIGITNFQFLIGLKLTSDLCTIGRCIAFYRRKYKLPRLMFLIMLSR